MVELLDHYPWRETFSYNADVTMVIAARNVGKTFGLREQFLRDIAARNERFVSVARYKSTIAFKAAGYFEKVLQDTEDEKLIEWRDAEKPCFQLVNNVYKMGHVLESGKKADWQTVGYFVHMSVKQDAKERTFMNVRRIELDEAIIEPEDMRYRSYLRDEWGNLASIVNSCTRERAGITQKPNVYLLSNAANIVNPWFIELGIDTVPAYGKHWYRNKTFLLDYVDPSRFKQHDASDTVAGRMLQGRAGGAMASSNVFEGATLELVEKRPRSAQYECAFIYRGKVFAIWTDWTFGMSYVSSKFVEGAGSMYALTTRDNKVNYIAAKAARRAMAQMIERYGYGQMRFESIALREGFAAMMRDFGVR